jgi:hypothetical protein
LFRRSQSQLFSIGFSSGAKGDKRSKGTLFRLLQVIPLVVKPAPSQSSPHGRPAATKVLISLRCKLHCLNVGAGRDNHFSDRGVWADDAE